MLTKSDLKQLETIVHDQVGEVVEEKLGTIRGDITSIKGDVKYLRKKVNRIDKTVNLIAKNYDEGDVRLERRVKIIEKHLDLPDNN